jgi:GNAT superfamily N-acetyltransferase
VTVRRAHDDDLDAVLGLVEHLFTPPASRPAGYDSDAARERARWWLASDDRRLLLAHDSGGAAVGYCAVAVDIESIRFGRRAWVEDLVVHADARSEGHGGALLTVAREFARERGCTHLELDTATARTDAQRFYAREGGAQSSLVYGWLVG